MVLVTTGLELKALSAGAKGRWQVSIHTTFITPSIDVQGTWYGGGSSSEQIQP